MKLFKFNQVAEVEGSIYAADQVVAFPADFDLAALPGQEVAEANVFVEHRPA